MYRACVSCAWVCLLYCCCCQVSVVNEIMASPSIVWVLSCLRVCLCPSGEVKGLKAQCNSLADAAQAEKFELLAAKQENEQLQDQIVQVRG